MNCVMCENKKELKASKIESYKFTECGLDNVTLHGVTMSKCNHCGEEYYNLGNLDKLHSLIASVLIRKNSRLNGKEIRFLRKYLGYSLIVFSGLLAYKHEHMSRVENDKMPTSEHLDRLIRFMICEKLPNREYNLQDLFIEKKLLPIKRLEFSMKKHEWKISKAA